MKKRDVFTERCINPEIYFNHNSLKKYSGNDISALAGTLEECGLSTSIHAPFMDLSPGAIDPAFRALTVERMKAALVQAAPFNPLAVVFHPGYDPLRFAEHRGAWLKNSLRTWREILPLAEDLPGTLFLIENIFEDDPATLRDLLEELPTPPFGFCFDVGHFQVFSRVPLSRWMESLGPFLREVHLHDNDGSGDSHRPPGRGTFRFDELFSFLGTSRQSILGTVEAHSESDLFESFRYLENLGVVP